MKEKDSEEKAVREQTATELRKRRPLILSGQKEDAVQWYSGAASAYGLVITGTE